MLVLINWLHHNLLPYADSVPLGLFAFVVSFLDELIPPIPSFTIMLMTGSFARIQDYPPLALFSLALFSALGKTLGAQIIYRLVDKLEDAFITKFGSFLKIKPEQIETFGNKLGHGAIDYIILIALRALPMIPSTLITVGSGLIRVPQRLFITSTFIGSIIRDSIYIYIGYMGTIAFEKYFHKTGNVQIIITSLIILAIIVIVGYHFYKNKKTTS